jgi:hypothetical protein
MTNTITIPLPYRLFSRIAIATGHDPLCNAFTVDARALVGFWLRFEWEPDPTIRQDLEAAWEKLSRR